MAKKETKKKEQTVATEVGVVEAVVENEKVEEAPVVETVEELEALPGEEAPVVEEVQATDVPEEETPVVEEPEVVQEEEAPVVEEAKEEATVEVNKEPKKPFSRNLGRGFNFTWNGMSY